MPQTAPSKLASVFDALAHSARGSPALPSTLPYFVIALLALLCSGLFVAMLVEERLLRHEAMQRDIDLTALQMGGRLTSVAEALIPIARDIGGGTLSEARFKEIADATIASHDELIQIDFVDPRLNRTWPTSAKAAPQPEANAVAAFDVALRPVLDAARRGHSPVYMDLPPGPRNSPIALAIPVYTGHLFRGAVVARIDPLDLIVDSVSRRTLESYRLTINLDERTLASTSSKAAPANALTSTVSIPPLPANFHLMAAAFRLETRFKPSVLAWVVAGLTLAVLVALTALMRFTRNQIRSDRALRAETSLRRAMEVAQATGLYVVNPHGVIQYVNRAFCQLTGATESELLGCSPPYPFWPPDQIENHHKRLREVLGGQSHAHGYESVLQCNDGSVLHASMYDTPLLDADNRQIGWMTSATDITASARARADLAAAYKRFTTVLESLDAAVSVVTADTGSGDREVLFANRAYLTRFGADAVGHARLAQFLKGRDAGEVHDPVTGIWLDVRERVIDWPFRVAAPVSDARLQIASDITLRKAADETARQQQEQLHFTSRLMTMGEMASSLAHELNQPLTAIVNYCQGSLSRLKRGQISGDDIVVALEKASTQAQRAATIIRRIRDFVKRSEPQRRATPPRQVVDNAIAFADLDAMKKGISIVANIDPRVESIQVDPLLIEQLLLNLLKNAITAIGPADDKCIDVIVQPSPVPGMAQFEVIDHGCGIPEENMIRLFEPFFSTKREGMGMGLNICRSIVEFHHGRLTVARNDASGGTIMRFTLPLTTPTASLESVEIHAPSTPGSSSSKANP